MESGRARHLAGWSHLSSPTAGRSPAFWDIDPSDTGSFTGVHRGLEILCN